MNAHLICVIFFWSHLVGYQVESCSKKAMDGPKTSAELQEAINNAKSGSTIELLPIEYSGDFILQTKNSGDTVILKGNHDLTNPNLYTKILGSSTALSVQSGIWTITALSIESGNLGVSLKGPKNVLRAVSMKNLKSGVEITGNGNTVDSCSITASSSGITVEGSDSVIKSVSLRGSGIRLSSGRNNIVDSASISEIAEGSKAIEISGDSSDNRIDSLSAEGLVNVAGNSNTFHGVSVKGPVNFLGCGNRLEVSSIFGLYAVPSCTPPNEMGSSNSIRVVQQSPFL